MSDPMATVEIEDVLASIRRLVSEDARASRPAAAVPTLPVAPDRAEAPAEPAPEAAPALVLTPALRVVEAEPPQVVAAEEPSISAPEDAPVAETTPDVLHWDDDAGDEELASASVLTGARVDAFLRGFGGLSVAPLDEAGAASQSFDIPAAVTTEQPAEPAQPSVLVLQNAVDADPAQDAEPEATHADSDDAALMVAAEDELGALALPDPLEDSANPPAAEDYDFAAEIEAATAPFIHRAVSAELSRLHLGDPIATDSQPEELLEAVAEALRPEPAKEEHASEPAEPAPALDAAELSVDEAALETAAAPPAPPEPEMVHTHAGELMQEPAAEHALWTGEDEPLDIEGLRMVVADIVRQELQGSLGERITLNVRKLVRREIQRALAVRELE